jgi:hypothetical protein
VPDNEGPRLGGTQPGPDRFASPVGTGQRTGQIGKEGSRMVYQWCTIDQENGLIRRGPTRREWASKPDRDFMDGNLMGIPRNCPGNTPYPGGNSRGENRPWFCGHCRRNFPTANGHPPILHSEINTPRKWPGPASPNRHAKIVREWAPDGDPYTAVSGHVGVPRSSAELCRNSPRDKPNSTSRSSLRKAPSFCDP